MKKIHALLEEYLFLAGGTEPLYEIRLTVPSGSTSMTTIGCIRVDMRFSFARCDMSWSTRG